MGAHNYSNAGVLVKNGNVEKALSIFKKRIKNCGIMNELKERTHYIKPSAKKRAAKLTILNRISKEKKTETQ
jgi:small subunit ribosomal protein S21